MGILFDDTVKLYQFKKYWVNQKNAQGCIGRQQFFHFRDSGTSSETDPTIEEGILLQPICVKQRERKGHEEILSKRIKSKSRFLILKCCVTCDLAMSRDINFNS